MKNRYFCSCAAFLPILATFLLSTQIHAQFGCGMDDAVAKTFNSGQNYSACDVDLSQVPIKTVRVVVHVFNKDDGTGNIPNNSSGNYYIDNLVQHASNHYGLLNVMELPTPSAYVPDCKIRLTVVAKYFWNNTIMHMKGNITNSNGTALYNFVQSQSIPEFNSAINVFLPGNFVDPTPSNPSGLGERQGIASGFGSKKWSLLEDVFYQYGLSNFWYPGNVLRHEIGHNMGLYHTFEPDRCDDTGPNTRAWNVDNNLMSYNPDQNSMTEDQVSRCHRWLQETNEILATGEQHGNLTGQVFSSGNDGTIPSSNDNTTYDFASTNAVVFWTTPSLSSIQWNQEFGSGTYTTNASGTSMNFSNMGYSIQTALWEDNCIEFTRTYDLVNESNYLVGPNPASSTVRVSVDDSPTAVYRNADNSIEEKPNLITKVEIFDANFNLLGTNSTGKTSEVVLDLSGFQSGTLYLLIHNGDHQKIHKVTKL